MLNGSLQLEQENVRTDIIVIMMCCY